MRARVKFEIPMRYPNGDVEIESGVWERGQGYGYEFVSHTMQALLNATELDKNT